MIASDSTLTTLPSADRYYCCPWCGGHGSGVAETYVNWGHCSRWRCNAGCQEPWYVIRTASGMEVDRVELHPPVPNVYSLEHLELKLAWALEPYAHRAGRSISYAAHLGRRLASALKTEVDVREHSPDPPAERQSQEPASDAHLRERVERIGADAMFGRDDDQIPCDHCGYTHTVEIRAQQEDLHDLLDEIRLLALGGGARPRDRGEGFRRTHPGPARDGREPLPDHPARSRRGARAEAAHRRGQGAR